MAPRKLEKLDQWTKGDMGVKRCHTRCIRCWHTINQNHRGLWRKCPRKCPACPDDDQHPGLACPKLLADTTDRWWVDHAGCPKADVERSIANKCQGQGLVGTQGQANDSKTCDLGRAPLREGPFMRGGRVEEQVAVGKKRLRSPSLSSGEVSETGRRERYGRHSSLSLKIEPTETDLDIFRQDWRGGIAQGLRQSSADARSRDRYQPRDDRPSLTKYARTSGSYFPSFSEYRPIREPTKKSEAATSKTFNPPTGPRPKGANAVLRSHLGSGSKHNDRKTIDPKLDYGSSAYSKGDDRNSDHRKLNGNSIIGQDLTGRKPAESTVVKSKAAVDASATQKEKPATKSAATQTDTVSAYDQVMEHPGMRMFLHQVIVFADYFDKHPEATYGQQVVTQGMRSYLRMAYADNPDYTNPNPPYEGGSNAPMERLPVHAAADQFLNNAFPNGPPGP